MMDDIADRDFKFPEADACTFSDYKIDEALLTCTVEYVGREVPCFAVIADPVLHEKNSRHIYLYRKKMDDSGEKLKCRQVLTIHLRDPHYYGKNIIILTKVDNVFQQVWSGELKMPAKPSLRTHSSTGCMRVIKAQESPRAKGSSLSGRGSQDGHKG
jgi:hypothetical protein